MKTGKQSNVFDYDTGEWNQNEAVPMEFSVEKPPFMAVSWSMKGESFEQQLIRLGKIGRQPSKHHDSGNQPGGQE